jgi:hypothetical protein
LRFLERIPSSDDFSDVVFLQSCLVLSVMAISSDIVSSMVAPEDTLYHTESSISELYAELSGDDADPCRFTAYNCETLDDFFSRMNSRRSRNILSFETEEQLLRKSYEGPRNANVFIFHLVRLSVLQVK